MNGKVLLVVVALCWAALAINLLGALLKRLPAIRKYGVFVQWLAFVTYVLGVGGTGMMLHEILSRQGPGEMASLIGGVTVIPIAICTVQFFKAAKQGMAGPAGASRLSP